MKHTCGLDVHKDTIFCAIYNGKKSSEVKEYSTRQGYFWLQRLPQRGAKTGNDTGRYGIHKKVLYAHTALKICENTPLRNTQCHK